MASQPPKQRRTSPTQRSSSPEAASSSQTFSRDDSEAHSTVSEDSQTILLNPSSSPSKANDTVKSEEKTAPPMSASPAKNENDLKKCWICFEDETEDGPLSSEWRSPCPCALEAHEQCLLDWIADMEAPNSRRQRAPSDKILCPQCKEEIHLARPKSYIVDTVKTLETVGHKLVLPGVLAGIVGATWFLCWAHGAHSVMLVFGHRDGEAILAPLLQPPPDRTASMQVLLDHWRQRVRLDLGLFCIPPMLIFARTTLADGILPILPILFFVTKPDADPFADVRTWPPSAGLSFALLPYLRGVYNALYERVWAEHEKRWLREVQPRAVTEAQEANAQNQNNAADDDDGIDNILELNIDLGIIDEWEEEAAQDLPPPLQPVGPPQAHPLNEPPLDAPQVGQAEQQAGIPAAAPAADAPRNRQPQVPNNAPAADPQNAAPPAAFPAERNIPLAISANKLFESALGSLAFPAISAVMGELLLLILPRKLTTFPVHGSLGMGRWWLGKPTGLLQQKWGRSLVGGAMFVVLKDAVMLYVRWRMARDHRMRRVLDFKGKRAAGR